MDGKQLDRIARSLGSGQTRRSVFKGVMTGLIAGIVGGRSMARATVEMCGLTDDPCVDEFDCCNTHYCDEETLLCVQFACGVEGDRCGEFILAQADDRPQHYLCCEGYVCNEETERCEVAGPICGVEGDACSDVTESQDGGTQGTCCNGFVCNDSICEPLVTCAAEGEACGDLACCGDLTCLDSGLCGYPAAPNDPAKPAPSPVVALPDTGAGIEGPGSDWLIPAALGAAAAAVAGRKLLASDGTPSDETA